jgi:hypothetical protein
MKFFEVQRARTRFQWSYVHWIGVFSEPVCTVLVMFSESVCTVLVCSVSLCALYWRVQWACVHCTGVFSESVCTVLLCSVSLCALYWCVQWVCVHCTGVFSEPVCTLLVCSASLCALYWYVQWVCMHCIGMFSELMCTLMVCSAILYALYWCIQWACFYCGDGHYSELSYAGICELTLTCCVQVCQHVPVYREPENGLSPTDLAARLTSIASSIHFRRDDQVGPITTSFIFHLYSAGEDLYVGVASQF